MSPFEQGEVRVHARALDAREGLRHEARVDAVRLGGLLDDEADGHDGVGHGERVGVAEVDLVLARSVLVLGVLDGDPHLLEGENALLAQVRGLVGRGQLEVGARVDGDREVAWGRSRRSRSTPSREPRRT